MTLEDARHFLLESAKASWLRMRIEPFPKCKFRQQAKREREIRIRARRQAIVPYRPAEWLGRPTTKAERRGLTEALRWFEGGGALKPIRGNCGRVVALQLVNATRESE